MTAHRYTFVLFLLIFSGVISSSCNRMDCDAEKAAKFTNRSIQKMDELKFRESEELYKKSQDIIRKYMESEKAVEFDERYRTYRDSGKRPNE